MEIAFGFLFSAQSLTVAAAAIGAYLAVTLILGILATLAQANQDVLKGPKIGTERGLSAFEKVLKSIGEQFVWMSTLTSENVTNAIEQRLIYAGRPFGGISGKAFFAGYTVIGLLLGTFVSLSVFGFRTFAQQDLEAGIVEGLATFLVVPVIAYLYGWLALESEVKMTGDEIVIEFPFFLDLAVLVVQAGGLPQDTFKQYVEAAPGTALSRELQVTIREAEAKSIETALLRMADRIQSPPIKMILRNLAQAQRTSGDLSRFYAEQAVELRSIRNELTEAAIEKLKVNLKLPEFMLMFGIAILAMAPTLIQMNLF